MFGSLGFNRALGSASLAAQSPARGLGASPNANAFPVVGVAQQGCDGVRVGALARTGEARSGLD